MTQALAEQWGMPVVNLEETNIQSNVLDPGATNDGRGSSDYAGFIEE